MKQAKLAWRDKETSFVLNLYNDDIMTRNIVTRGTFYEAGLLKDLEIRCKDKPGAVIDVGANIGNHTVFFAGIMRRIVFAIEPLPDNFTLLAANIAANGLTSRVIALPVAASNDNGFCDIRTDNPFNLGGSVTMQGDSFAKIKLDSLHRLIEPHGLALVKIDVEGHEPNVLMGLFNLLFNYRPVVAVEAANKDAKGSADIILEQFGYQPVGVFNATPTYVYEVQE